MFQPSSEGSPPSPPAGNKALRPPAGPPGRRRQIAARRRCAPSAQRPQHVARGHQAAKAGVVQRSQTDAKLALHVPHPLADHHAGAQLVVESLRPRGRGQCGLVCPGCRYNHWPWNWPTATGSRNSRPASAPAQRPNADNGQNGRRSTANASSSTAQAAAEPARAQPQQAVQALREQVRRAHPPSDHRDCSYAKGNRYFCPGPIKQRSESGG